MTIEGIMSLDKSPIQVMYSANEFDGVKTQSVIATYTEGNEYNPKTYYICVGNYEPKIFKSTDLYATKQEAINAYQRQLSKQITDLSTMLANTLKENE